MSDTSKQSSDPKWCEVELADSGRYPVVTNLWLDDDGAPNFHHHEFGLTPNEARALARELNRVAREAEARGR